MKHRFPPHTNSDSRVALIKQLRARVRTADFGDDLLQSVDAVQKSLRELKRKDELSYYKGLCSCAEILDYYGKFVNSRELVAEEGVAVLREMSEWKTPNTPSERDLLKQKLWLVGVHYAQTLYRSHRYAEARKITSSCERIVKVLLRSKDYPCHNTLARFSCCIAQCYRQLHDYERSRQMFIRAIDYLRLNLENKARVYLPAPCDETSDEDEKVQRRLRFDQEKAQVARRTALCLALGLGWISYTQGLLRHALPFVLTAQTLLCATNDWINKAYVELLYGSIQRSMAGYDVAKLAEAIQILLRPYGIFERHLPYRSRAAWELALASLYSSKYLEAENYLEEVRRIAEDAEDERWQCNAMILESRIHRRKRDPLKAANVASDALRKAHDAGQVLCEIDALITRGEARLDLGDYRDARSDFTDALKQGNSNAQTQAVCHLHLADTALKENNIRLAEEHYSEWQKVEHYVENAIVQALAENVGSAIAQQRSDFVIPWTSDDLNFEHHVDLLWEFLLKQARRKHTSKDQIARVLGVSRQTLYKRSLSSRE